MEIIPFSSSTPADMTVAIGFDINNNSVLDLAEQFKLRVHDKDNKDIGPSIIHATSTMQYVADHDACLNFINTLARTVPYARTMFKIFYFSGTKRAELASKYMPTTEGHYYVTPFSDATPSSSCFSEWLSHNAGAVFDDKHDYEGEIPSYIWISTSDLAEMLAWSAPIGPFLYAFYERFWEDPAQDPVYQFYNTQVAPDAANYFNSHIFETSHEF